MGGENRHYEESEGQFYMSSRSKLSLFYLYVFFSTKTLRKFTSTFQMLSLVKLIRCMTLSETLAFVRLRRVDIVSVRGAGAVLSQSLVFSIRL